MLTVDLDQARRLAGVCEQLAGRWRFGSEKADALGRRSVDVAATNAALNAHAWTEGGFVASSPEKPRVPDVENICSRVTPIPARQLIVVLLCGGLSTRSAGLVRPWTRVQLTDGEPRSLIGLQVERLRRGPLSNARLLLFASPLNVSEVFRPLEAEIGDVDVPIYTGGVVPRLAIRQTSQGDIVEARGSSGGLVYNPAGHLDAIRWLVIHGILHDLDHDDVIVTMSYSNWGAGLFGMATRSLAEYARSVTEASPERLFVAEVAPAASSKKTGSLLVTRAGDSDDFRLAKRAYASSGIAMPTGSQVLMSTNTLYFPVGALRERLELKPYRRPGVGRDRDTAGERKGAAEGFDAVLPVPPYLSLKPLTDGTESIQAERDLDQLSLIGETSPLVAVRVSDDRTHSLKYPQQLAEVRRLVSD